MKIIIIVVILAVTFFSGCGEEGESWEDVMFGFYIINKTSNAIYVGNFVAASKFTPGRKTRIVGIPAKSSDLYWGIDTDDQLDFYHSNWDLALATSLREIGSCMYSSEITNQTNILTAAYSNEVRGVYGYYLGTADDPTNQVLPSSLIYRMQITTNDIEADGRYSWEIETNARPFYLVCPTNGEWPSLVIRSIMTNVTN